MQLKDLFQPSDILLDFEPSDKWEAIGLLMEHLVAAGHIESEVEEGFREQVLERERSMSTGMERGIAIPHAAVDGLADVAACMGVVRGEEGLPFESIDARPTRLVVLLLIPRAQKLLHIRTLADIARVLGKDEVRQGLLAARGSDEAWQALVRGEGATV